jgi:hypothetical protein
LINKQKKWNFATLFSFDDKSVSFNVNTGISSSWLLSDNINGKGCPRRYRLLTILSSFVLWHTGVTVKSVLSNNLTKWSEWESWNRKMKLFFLNSV